MAQGRVPGLTVEIPEAEFQQHASLRREVGSLLADAFTGPGDVEDRAQLLRAAHWGDPPSTRIYECDEAGTVIAHVALFDVDHDASPPHRVIGIGDLVVHPDHRGRGLATGLIAHSVDSARNAADVIFARSTSMRRAFEGHGFKATRISALSRRPGWLAWSRMGRLPRYRWLEPNDV